DPEARARIVLVEGRGEEAEPPPGPIDLLYVDSNHDRAVVRRSFERWRDSIASGGFAAFDDYANVNYPGVREAVAALGLRGQTVGRLFIWKKEGALELVLLDLADHEVASKLLELQRRAYG